MKKDVSNYLEVFPSITGNLTSNLSMLLSQIPDTLLKKIAERERIEIKAKRILRKKNLAN